MTVSCNLCFRTVSWQFFKTGLHKTLQFNCSKACLITGLLCTQLQLWFWKPVPLVQEYVRAPTDLSSHQNGDGLANKESLFCACYQYGTVVRDSSGLEKTDFFVLGLCWGSPARPAEPPALPMCSKLQRNMVGFCRKTVSYSKAV